MSRSRGDLTREFPEHSEKIDELKENHSHFRRLSDEYDAIVREIDRMEELEDDKPVAVTKELEDKRLALKDEIFRVLMSI